MSHIGKALILVASGLCAPAGMAQQEAPASPLNTEGSTSILARSVGMQPSRETVSAVARLAEPSQFTAASWPTLPTTKVNAAIIKLCGSVQPGYVDALARSNASHALALEKEVGSDAFEIVWPACLFSSTDERLTKAIVAEGETPTQIMERNTGYGLASAVRTRGIFGISKPKLFHQKPIKIAFVTVPTVLHIKGPIEEFRAAVGPSNIVQAEPLRTGGSIIAPTSSDCAGTAEDYPFRTSDIVAAFNFTARDRVFSPVRVAVVDNGFYGVPCGPEGCPIRNALGHLTFKDPFPPALFDSLPAAAPLGPKLATGPSPLNYQDGVAPGEIDAVRGHGTHVAGLTLGGGHFFPEGRTIFRSGPGSWFKLAVVSLGADRLTFPAGTDGQLMLSMFALERAEIVNMSLALSKEHSQFVEKLVRSPDWQNSLFVAAAGNDSQSVEVRKDYPAILGGPATPNVLTVAASDAQGRLAPFSNWGPVHVDLAAPGCKIRSWLTLEAPLAELSGTSQSAPLASFGAAMLRALDRDMSAREVKNRLILSGTILSDPVDRSKTRYGVNLNLFKALLIAADYIRFIDISGVERAFVGSLRTINSLSCLEGETTDWEDVRAFKRTGPNAYLFSETDRMIRSCPATVSTEIGLNPNTAYFVPTHEFSNGTFNPLTTEEAIPVARIVEFVRAG
jgi:Subtilase family